MSLSVNKTSAGVMRIIFNLSVMEAESADFRVDDPQQFVREMIVPFSTYLKKIFHFSLKLSFQESDDLLRGIFPNFP